MSIKFIVSLLLLATSTADASLISRIKTFSDGEILTASDLNSEFSNVVDGVNSISNANIATNADIAPSKIASGIAGSAISRNPSTGALSCAVDDVGIEISGNALQLKNLGVVTAKIADSAITGIKLNTSAADGSTLEVASGSMRVKDGGITQEKLATKTVQKSSSCGNSQITYSGSTVDVNNLSVSITTTGRPVVVGVIPDNTGTIFSGLSIERLTPGEDYMYTDIYLVRGVTTVFQTRMAHFYNGFHPASRLELPSGFVYSIDTPVAGTYTYKIRAQVGNTNGAFDCRYSVLFAYEL